MPDAPVSPILQMREVEKRFGSTVALDGVDLTVLPGEVHAVLGENGAGKSTLMNVLCGVHAPDSGTITLAEKPYFPRNPAHAGRNGLAMIHQELTLAPHLSVETNILIGVEDSRAGFLANRSNRSRARAALDQLERPDIDLGTPVRELGIGDQQLVEIARALVVDARIIVMDEPTSSLSGDDREHLFKVIRNLKNRGLAIVYISHFLEEVDQICDRFTVLRDGKTVGTGDVADTPRSEIIHMMVGREIAEVFPKSTRTPGQAIIEVEGLSGRTMPTDVSFQLRRGEILGLAGLIGAGRTETLRALFGLDPSPEGEVKWIAMSGRASRLGGTPRSSINRGIGLLSEDRKSEGLATNLSIAENIALASPETISRFGFINSSKLTNAADRHIGDLAIKTGNARNAVSSLSGGNQQKVAIARLLQMDADVFLLDEPTRGIDIGSKVEIYRLIDKLANQGKAVLMVSSYLPELIGLCDRIAVMSRGRIAEIRNTADWTETEIMAAATGSTHALATESN